MTKLVLSDRIIQSVELKKKGGGRGRTIFGLGSAR